MTKYGDTLGAILIGGFVALFLSGIVFMQTMIYYRVYGKDPIRLKLIVSVVWLLDMIHSAFTISVDWYYLVSDREDDSYLRVYWPVPACIASTSVVTSVVMSFYIHRVWTLSGHKAYLAVPMMILNLFRVAAGFASAAEVARKTYLYEFTMSVDWPFVATLATSSFLDFLVATILVILLRRSRTGLFNMDQVLDSITLYTVENGLLTAVTTIVSLVCWVTMPYNLIFLGIHFTIAKLYANAFLATLNARKILQERTRHVGITATDVAPGSDGIRFSQYNSHLRKPSDATDHSDESTRLNSLKNAVLKINIRRSIHRDRCSNPNSPQTESGSTTATVSPPRQTGMRQVPLPTTPMPASPMWPGATHGEGYINVSPMFPPDAWGGK